MSIFILYIVKMYEHMTENIDDAYTLCMYIVICILVSYGNLSLDLVYHGDVSILCTCLGQAWIIEHAWDRTNNSHIVVNIKRLKLWDGIEVIILSKSERN